jgi:tRNA (guanosine-2'-O-)-methyltransferase
MFGFTESLNISVSAAICLNTVMSKARNSSTPIGLSGTETTQIRYEWYRKAIRKPDIVEKDFLMNQSRGLPQSFIKPSSC